MNKEIITFGDIQIEKPKFYLYKNSIFLKDTDINKMLISGKFSSGEKIINTLLVL